MEKKGGKAYVESADYIRALQNDAFKASYSTKQQTEETKNYLVRTLKKIREANNELNILEKEAHEIFESLKTAKSFQKSENIVKAVSESLISRKDFITNLVNQANVISNQYIKNIEKNRRAINDLSYKLIELGNSFTKISDKIESMAGTTLPPYLSPSKLNEIIENPESGIDTESIDKFLRESESEVEKVKK